MNQDMIAYYALRAQEYERVYQKPERQSDLAAIKHWLADQVRDLSVLEIACGTGYWTEPMSTTALSIQATDINQEVLEVAQAKSYSCSVQLAAIDLYDLSGPAMPFDLVVGGFIWSHIRLEQIPQFLAQISSQLSPGGSILILDNRYVEGSNTPIAFTDEAGNTFQDRKLQDGSLHRVLKNFPTEESMRQLIAPVGTAIQWLEWEYYWAVSFQID